MGINNRASGFGGSVDGESYRSYRVGARRSEEYGNLRDRYYSEIPDYKSCFDCFDYSG